jgi:hypothetical protein
VTFQVGCAAISTGSEASSSGTVHITLRPAVAVRTRVTSATVVNGPVLPKLLRT